MPLARLLQKDPSLLLDPAGFDARLPAGPDRLDTAARDWRIGALPNRGGGNDDAGDGVAPREVLGALVSIRFVHPGRGL